MENRFAVIALIFFAGGLFMTPVQLFAVSSDDVHRVVTNDIVRFANFFLPQKFTTSDHARIAWGVAHEGIPARAMHHGNARLWMHDAALQSSRVYEGVYTWEQGIYDFARGDRERALETLGHALRLLIDQSLAHIHTPITEDAVDLSALRRDIQTLPSFITPDDAFVLANDDAASQTSWRAIIVDADRRVMTSLLRRGAGLTHLFLAQAEDAKKRAADDPSYLASLRPHTEKRGDAITNFFGSAAVTIKERMRGGVAALRSLFARTSPLQVGGASASFALTSERTPVARGAPPIPVVPARFAEPRTEPILAHSVFSKSSFATSLFIATPSPSSSVVIAPPIIEEPPLPQIIAEPIVPPPPPLLMLEPPSSPSPPASPPSVQPAPVFVDDFWTYFGSTPRSRDRTPPDTTLTSSPSLLIATSTVAFMFTASDANEFLCVLDAEPSSACSSPRTYDNLADGAHTFSVSARDLAGNDDPTPATATWTIDTTPPYAPILVSPTTETVYTTTLASVTLEGAREASAVVTVDGATEGVTLPSDTVWQKIIGLALGVNTVTVAAIDSAGNTSAPLTLVITRTEEEPPPADPPPPPPPPDPPPPPPVAIIRIQTVAFAGGAATESVVFVNDGTANQDFAGWTVSDEAKTPHTYTFGAFTLAPGATVTLHTGAGTDTLSDVYWNRGSGVWNDSGDTVFLKDNTGVLIDSESW